MGATVRTRTGVRPLFVSPGHRIGLRAAVGFVLTCSRFRVPDPIREAEQLVSRLRAQVVVPGSGTAATSAAGPTRWRPSHPR